MFELTKLSDYGKSLTQRWGINLVELIAPSCCFLCHHFNFQGPDPWLCPNCERDLPIIGGAQSRYTQSLMQMQAGAEQLIHAFKYQGKRQLLPTLVRLIQTQPQLVQFIQNVEAIIPVPMHKQRLRRRGFNQAQLLAKTLARIYAIPLYSNTLIKTQATEPQSQLTRKERLNNLQNSIEVNTQLLPHQHKLLLVDDVITTGATLNACAQALLKALPHAQIFTFTLARTPDHR